MIVIIIFNIISIVIVTIVIIVICITLLVFFHFISKVKVLPIQTGTSQLDKMSQHISLGNVFAIYNASGPGIDQRRFLTDQLLSIF